MPKLIANTKDMSEAEWLQARNKGIGGSDASTVLKLNKWKSPFQLWLEKTNQVEVESAGSEAAEFGNKLEAIVAETFTERTGIKVRKRNAIFAHDEHDFMRANVDRVVVGENAGLECKTASAFLMKDWKGEEIPDAYLIQCQHYMAVMGWDKMYIAVLVGGNSFIWKEVERDEELIGMIITHEQSFWEHNVIGNIAPPIDGSSAAEQFLNERYKNADDDKFVDLSSDYGDKIKELQKVESEIKAKNERKKELQNDLKLQLEDAVHGYVGSFQVSWKPQTQKRVDSKKLKAEYPDVFEQVQKEINMRKFSVKELSE